MFVGALFLLDECTLRRISSKLKVLGCSLSAVGLGLHVELRRLFFRIRLNKDFGFVWGLWFPGVRLGCVELKLYLVAGGDGSVSEKEEIKDF